MATIQPPTNASGTARPGRPSEGFRIAPPARQTRPMLGVVAVLLILVGGATGAYLYLQAGSRTEVIAVARLVPPGHRITRDDLRGVRVSPDTGLAASTSIGHTDVSICHSATLCHSSCICSGHVLIGWFESCISYLSLYLFLKRFIIS